MIYRWVEGARRRGGAQVVGEQLEAIRERNGGALTPLAVVEDAEPDDSPLHPHFEWDDEKAAEAFRLEQARGLIADVTVVYAEEVAGAPTDPVRAFVSLGSGSARAYTSTLDAMRSPELSKNVLSQAKAELEGWRRRYRLYSALAAAVKAVEGALDSMPERAA